jgi:hypothetical protein
MNYVNITDFEIELKQLINKYSMEIRSDTPDYVLALYLRDCLNAFNTATIARDRFFGIENPFDIVFERHGIKNDSK